jgi:hypothetical protein
VPDLETRAAKIGEATGAAWWGAHGGNLIEIPLGVVAALALTTQADPTAASPAKLISGLDRDELADLLRAIWANFAIARPDLSIRVGPFARWLDEQPTDPQLRGAHATALAVIKAGQLDLTGHREIAAEIDLLGRVYQHLRSSGAKKAHGEVYTPTAIADAMARQTLADARPGQSIHDPCAGTGGLLRAAAQALRARGTDPHTMWWYAVDVDPIAVAALAVNVHLWDLGPQVVIGHADTLAEPDWHVRAVAERDRAVKEHNFRVTAALFLALDRLITDAASEAAGARAPEGPDVPPSVAAL